MSSNTRKCKVCGESYEYCHTAKHTANTFRWQDVACCPEHGSTYLTKIRLSRATSLDGEKSLSLFDEEDDAELDNELSDEDLDIDEEDV